MEIIGFKQNSAGNDVDMLYEVKQWLFKTFEMNHLSETSYILGIKIERDRVKKKWLNYIITYWGLGQLQTDPLRFQFCNITT